VSTAIRLVIFDCDGVLVDSERIAVRIDVAVLTELGWPMAEAEVIERFMGRTDEYMASQIEVHFLHAANRMGAHPADCVVIEDSRYGVEAARAAGMRAFGYAGGLTPRHRLEGSGTVVFEDMRELPRLLNL
jgi:beta-phosphoglucomutase-like phosphatase (HAD superfamily)